MTELWLKFDDKKVSVNRGNFVVGRHSECDLSVADGRLSRQHLKIERFGDIFAASDLGSSNGTTINGRKLEKPTTLRNGDALSLGGLEIKAEISSGAFSGDDSFGSFDDVDDAPAENEPAGQANNSPEKSAPVSNQPSAPKSSTAAPAETGSIPKTLFLIAPICALVVVAMVIGAFLFFGKKDTELARRDDFIYSNENSSPNGGGDEIFNSEKEETPKPTATAENSPANNSGSPAGSTIPVSENVNSEPTTPPKNQPDTVKVETNSASFLRKIAQNNPKAFLTSEQAQAVNAKIKQFSNSSSLADNIKSARSNASGIQSLAVSKNLKPQFVAVAALTKMGGSRGNVLQTATLMSDILDKLSIQLGNELADDSVLTMAVYDQGEAGDFLKTRNMLQDLSNKFPESSRTIRTIWFLHKNNKITDAEYDFALRFLAIGTITQNPKDFGVNAEELKLN